MKHKVFKFFTSCLLAALFAFQPLNSFAASSDLLYEYKNLQTVTSGVTYEKSSRLYKGGWMDIYVLTVDMKNPNVSLDVLESTAEFGLKQSVERIANDNNAVAAVNGDFFGSGAARSSMGQVMRGGNLSEAQNYYNSSANNYAGLFIDNEQNAFIDYVKTLVGFYNSPESIIELQGKNKVTDFAKPVYFDRTAMNNTAQLDKRFSNLYKIVVSNGAIKDISAAGATVEIPEDGYIIAMNSKTALEKLKYFTIGQKVSFTESAAFLFRPQKQVSEIQLGISGGGELLRNGENAATGLIIGQNGRNPRTAVGVTQDKSKVIIMAIDGRGKSIGATHTETANLMREYGAYDAIHLDGGGSTTVVVRDENGNELNVENTPSEGGQRAVANALGVKSVGESDGQPAGVNMSIQNHADNIILNGAAAVVAVKGYDINQNPVDVDFNNVVFSHSGVEGTWSGNVFTPSSEGDLTITASINGNTNQLNAKVVSPAVSITAKANSNSLSAGESTYLTASLINKDAFSSEIPYSQVDWIVENPAVGHVEGGKFIADADGNTNVTAVYNGLSASLNMNVGLTVSYITDFEEERKMKMLYYPDDIGISGGAGITNAQYHDGTKSLMLSYNFVPNSTVTQASYVSFDEQPINLNGNVKKVSMWVKGDNSGNLLKMVLSDANNSQFNVTVSESLNFNDWQHFTASVPADAVYPLKITRLYVASLSTDSSNTSGAVYVDNISQMAANQGSFAVSGNGFSDYMNTDLSSAPSALQEDITVFGQTATKTTDTASSVLNAALVKMQSNARALVFAGFSDSSITASVPVVKWEDKYITTETSNFSIINLATNNGSIRKSNADQWKWLQGYLDGFSKNNIIINMDKDIWSSSYGLSDSRENKLFHDILKDFSLKTGKNVMVVSACGYTSGAQVVDGIRYVTLNGLSSTNPTNLQNYKYLRIRGDADNMYYQIQSVY